MIRLIGVELTRLRWRQGVIALLLAAILIPAAIFASTAWSGRPISEGDRAAAARLAEHDEAMCRTAPGDWGVESAEECFADPEWFIGREPLDLAQQMPGGAGAAAFGVLLALMILLGATFVGHDWTSGSMSNQLLFEPRRLRVWWAKATAVFLAGALITGAVLAVLWSGLALLGSLWDLPELGSSLTDGYLQALRGTITGGAAAVGGYALTMLFRSTVATLGALFAATVASGMVLAVLGIGEVWQPAYNVAAVIGDGATYWVFEGSGEGREESLSLTRGAVYLAVLLVLACATSLSSFRRRDVS